MVKILVVDYDEGKPETYRGMLISDFDNRTAPMRICSDHPGADYAEVGRQLASFFVQGGVLLQSSTVDHFVADGGNLDAPPPQPRKEPTWLDLAAWLIDLGFKDEYINVAFGAEEIAKQPIFTLETKRACAWWCVGTSEGYYVHIERITAPPDQTLSSRTMFTQCIIIAKFWDWWRAEQCTTLANRFIVHCAEWGDEVKNIPTVIERSNPQEQNHDTD